MKNELEIDIEEEFVDIALKKYGCWSIKFKHIGIKGAPDRIVFCPGGHVFFIEFKRGKNDASPHQEEFAKTLKKLNFNVYFCWNVKDAITALDAEVKSIKEKADVNIAFDKVMAELDTMTSQQVVDLFNSVSSTPIQDIFKR